MEIGGINNYNRAIIDSNSAKTSEDSFETTLKNAIAGNDAKQLRKACDDFEGIFLSMMYKEMKATVPESELIPEDSGREVFEDMLDEQLIKGISDGKGTGLSDVLYNQLSKQLKINE